MEMISIIRKEPGKPFYRDLLVNELEAFQEAVGGYIEAVTISGAAKPIIVICDEEGRLKGYEHNVTIAGIDFVGPIVICSAEGEEFTDAAYSIEFIKKITKEEA